MSVRVLSVQIQKSWYRLRAWRRSSWRPFGQFIDFEANCRATSTSSGIECPQGAISPAGAARRHSESKWWHQAVGIDPHQPFPTGW